MQGYQYTHGDRPLEGYTIQRAVGRGGFGEVYYAVSDSGREVALKCVQGYEEIELRGIGQCMNLKSPHLVTIFDVRHNEQGKPFVLMEYVAGPSLRDLLTDSPSGLGPQKSAFFLREIAKGLTYLHDRGVVHRDLKPGNIFYEDGYVKIGDYGLSKAMTASQHSGQTITVGTVHYMAPEIGKGRYDQGIDVYALGVVLFEMLTGQVPFFGASPAEILMKHVADEPDLSQIDEPFATVVARAMAKDPAKRYQSAQEVVEAVFGTEHIRESVSHFRPESLTVAAERIGQKVVAGRAGASGSSADPTMTLGADVPRGAGSSNGRDEPENWWEDFGRRMGEWGEHMGRWGSRFGRDVAGHAHAHRAGREPDSWSDIEPGIVGDPKQDPLKRRQRHLLATTAAMIVSVGLGVLMTWDTGDVENAVVVVAGAFSAIAGAVAAMLVARYRLKIQSESDLIKRLAYGGLACLASMAFLPITLAIGEVMRTRWPDDLPNTVLSICLALLLVNWQKRTSPARPDRVALGSSLSAGLAAAVMAWICGGDFLLATGILAGVSLAVQVASPFDPKAARDWQRHQHEMRRFWRESGIRARGESPPTEPGLPGQTPVPPPPVPGQRPGAPGHTPQRQDRAGRTVVLDAPVPDWVRPIAFLGFVLLLGLGVVMLVWSGMTHSDDELVIGVSAGVGSVLLALFCFVKAFQRTYRSWWSSLVKPLAMIACVEVVLVSSLGLGMFSHGSDETLLLLFLIIFPSLLFFVILALPNAAMHPLFGRPLVGSTLLPHEVSTRRRMWALMLTAVGVLGVCGLQRFYVGKIWTGLLWLCTGGLLGIGQIYDLILIAGGRFRDRHNLPVIIWHTADELKHPSSSLAGASPDRAVGYAADPADLGADRPTPPPSDAPQPSSGQANRAAALQRALAPVDVIGVLLSFIGSLLLMVALAAGLLAAIDSPQIIAAGLPDADLAQELERELGFANWPHLLEQILMVTSAVAAFLAVACLVVARRRGGILHMARAVLGSYGMLFAIFRPLSESLEDIQWDRVAAFVNGDQVGRAIEMILDTVDVQLAALAGAALLVSIVVLVWPARSERERQAQPTTDTDGGA